MRKIVYYVAMTVDGYIAGPNENIDGYVNKGTGLDQYLEDLKKYDTVIMGRKTYEFGFKFGITTGLPAYEHMDHYIFSTKANYPNAHEKVKIIKPNIELIKELKNGEGTDIYLCGGGIFAGWLLEHEMIDQVKIKLRNRKEITCTTCLFLFAPDCVIKSLRNATMRRFYVLSGTKIIKAFCTPYFFTVP